MLCCPSADAAGGGAAQAVSYTWTGLYGGLNIGYGWGSSDWDFANGSSTSPGDNEGVIGLQFGYNAQIGNNLFAGLEADLDASRIDGKSSCFGSDTCETHVSSLGDISARAGVLVNPQTMLYLKGGMAYEDATHHILTPGGADRSDGGGAVYGYVIGAGAEYALGYDFSTKLEYNYLDFGSNNSTISPNVGISAKENISLLKLGMNFKFTE